MSEGTLFSRLPHPFVSSRPDQREKILQNVNDPIWHRFLEEAESHFRKSGEVQPPRAGHLFCHDGDLDEVMAAAVLGFVREDRWYGSQVGEWLRGLLSIYEGLQESWAQRFVQISKGEIPEGGPENPRQFVDTLTPAYWLEGGFMIMVLDLYDQLEAYAPEVLSPSEKRGLERMLCGFAERYIYHEESCKYSNRGLWANNAILAAAIVHPNPRTAKVLLERSWERYRIFRSTFFDDGLHGEGSRAYHVMSLEGIFFYALTASSVFEERDCFGATAKNEAESLALGYPGYVEMAQAYVRGALPGKVPMNSPRGASGFRPVSINPCFLHAYSMSRCPELGWMIRQRASMVNEKKTSPLEVTRCDLLGLGFYEPLKSFWVYRPVENEAPPRTRFHVFPDHGEVISRSGWGAESTAVTTRFGYEGTGKGHRDFGHVTFTRNGVNILQDPFPLGGLNGNDSSLFHNTVTLDNLEPTAVIGVLASQSQESGADTYLVRNRGGEMPDRAYLNDPREDANSYFCNRPQDPSCRFDRAVLHIHGELLLIFDQVLRKESSEEFQHIDWFFHSELLPDLFDESRSAGEERYRLQRKNICQSDPSLELPVQFSGEVVRAGEVRRVGWAGVEENASLLILPMDGDLELSTGHLEVEDVASKTDSGNDDYFLRARQQGLSGKVFWGWGLGDRKWDVDVKPLSDGAYTLAVSCADLRNLVWKVDFMAGTALLI